MEQLVQKFLATGTMGCKGFPILYCKMLIGDLMIWAIGTQCPIAKRKIDQCTMMRSFGILMNVRTKVAAGHTHSAHRNLSGHLKFSNHSQHCSIKL